MDNTSQRHIIRETPDLFLYLDTRDGVNVFVKQAKTDIGAQNNAREFHNQAFLDQQTHIRDMGFVFVVPRLEGKNLVFTALTNTVDWLATNNTPSTSMAPLSEYMQTMLTFLQACQHIRGEELPVELQQDAHMRQNKLWTNFHTDSDTLKTAELITSTEGKKMQEAIEKGLSHQAYQHHDLVPWHMARRKNDDKLILVDAGWAGWSLQYYDVAYYVLQMTGYAERAEEAQQFLSTAKKEFHTDPTLHEALASAFSYRSTRLAAELYRQGKEKNAREVLQIVFTHLLD